MADALFITGSVDYDGSDWFTDDPLVVDVELTDPDGGALSGADVTVALVPYDGDSTEALKTVQAGADGTVSVSLTAGAPGIYRIQAGAQTSDRQGYADIGAEEAVPKPPFDIGTVTVVGELNLDLTDSTHSITTALV